MRTETIKIGEKAELKTYLWDVSAEYEIIARPAVLVLPGGAYMMCSDREAEPVALAYMAEGFNSFVLRYTTEKAFAPAFADACAALALIRARAQEWNILADRVAVCGFSAGGHLACSLGVLAEERPDAMVLGYPAVIGKDWEAISADIPDLVSRVDKDTAPAFVTAAVDDRTVPIKNSIDLMTAFNENGVPFECHLFADGGHGFSLAKMMTSALDEEMVNADTAKWFDLSVCWLKKTMGYIQYRKRPHIPADLSDCVYHAVKEFLLRPDTREIVLHYLPDLADDRFAGEQGDIPLRVFMVRAELSAEDMYALSAALERLLQK